MIGFSREQIDRFTRDWTPEQIKTLRQCAQIVFARGSKAATKRALLAIARQRRAAEFDERAKD